MRVGCRILKRVFPRKSSEIAVPFHRAALLDRTFLRACISRVLIAAKNNRWPENKRFGTGDTTSFVSPRLSLSLFLFLPRNYSKLNIGSIATASPVPSKLSFLVSRETRDPRPETNEFFHQADGSSSLIPHRRSRVARLSDA